MNDELDPSDLGFGGAHNHAAGVDPSLSLRAGFFASTAGPLGGASATPWASVGRKKRGRAS